MMLSDSEIKNHLLHDIITIDPEPTEKQIQPCSVDLKLGCTLLKYKDSFMDFDLDNGHSIKMYKIDITGRSYSIKPGEFILASTEEYIRLPDTIAARVEGKSSLARLGLMVHVTAGFIDPGFRGNITLELCNLNNRPIALRQFMKISQLCFFKVQGHVENPYGSECLGSHYQDSVGTIGPRR